MKHASISFLALAFSLSGLFMACASGSETNTTAGVGSGGAGGNKTSSTDVGTTTGTTDPTTTVSTGGNTTTGGGQCVATCKADNECQGSCPAPKPGSSNCCDTQTNICYVSNSGSCPTNNTTTGASTGSSMYP